VLIVRAKEEDVKETPLERCKREGRERDVLKAALDWHTAVCNAGSDRLVPKEEAALYAAARMLGTAGEDIQEMRGQISGLRETLEGIGAVVGVTKDSPVGERSVTVAVHALMCRARDVVACFKKVGGTGSLYLEAPGAQAEQAILELRKLVDRSVEVSSPETKSGA
jgi:hypothetical protein